MDTGLTVDIRSMRFPSKNGTGHDLIDGLSFDVAPRQRVAFVGRSGAGKTTLLRVVAGLETSFQGTVTLNGRRIDRPSRSVQLLFQDNRLMPWKTVFGNVAFATDDPSGKSTSAGVVAALGRVGLAERLDDWPKNLSGGEAARVAIARALIARPAMLLLDEPFQSLDLITRYEVEQQLLLALAAARPMVLLVSHDIEDAVFLSDTVHILSYRPMRIARTFSVPLPYPRLRGDGALSAIANEIAAFLAAASHGVPAVS